MISTDTGFGSIRISFFENKIGSDMKKTISDHFFQPLLYQNLQTNDKEPRLHCTCKPVKVRTRISMCWLEKNDNRLLMLPTVSQCQAQYRRRWWILGKDYKCFITNATRMLGLFCERYWRRPVTKGAQRERRPPLKFFRPPCKMCWT